MRTVPELSHDAASDVIDVVRRELEESGGGAAVAVVDAHGELMAFLRTDGCPLASIDNAIHKAFTAARERVESAVIGQRSRAEEFAITNFGDLRYTGWGGGVPIEIEPADIIFIKGNFPFLYKASKLFVQYLNHFFFGHCTYNNTVVIWFDTF